MLELRAARDDLVRRLSNSVEKRERGGAVSTIEQQRERLGEHEIRGHDAIARRHAAAESATIMTLTHES